MDTVEAMCAAYLAEVAPHGVTLENARALETLIHDPAPWRVVDYVSTTAGEIQQNNAPFSQLVVPGAGLGALSAAERKKLVRFTHKYYNTTQKHPNEPNPIPRPLVALLNKTRATAEEIRQTRASRRWANVPTWTEWATTRRLSPAVCAAGRARVLECTGPSAVLQKIGRTVWWWPELIEKVVGALDDADKRAAERHGGGLAVMPRSMHLSFHPTNSPAWVARRQQAITNKTLTLHGDAGGACEARTSARELAGLTVPHFRVLFGLCDLLAHDTPTEREGQPFFQERLTLSAADFYRAGAVNTTHQKSKHDLFMAAVELSERKIQHELTIKGAKGEPQELILIREEVLHLAPVFDHDPTLARRWQDWHIARAKLPEDERPAWDGPLPSGYVFTLPKAMQYAGSPFVFSRDVFRRLEHAAKELRGKLHPLDLSLFIEATITRQSQQYDAFAVEGAAEPVPSFRCYIDPEQFLEDYLPKVRKKDRSRAQEQYAAALEVNVKAGTFIAVERNVRTKKKGELRDVVVPNPDLIPGLAGRAEGAREHAQLKAKTGAARRARKASGAGPKRQKVRDV